MGLSLKLTWRLQQVQNTVRGLITGERKFDHISPVLAELHWLPVVSKARVKVLFLRMQFVVVGQG